MRRIKLGVCLESLGLPLRKGLLECARMGVTGVQLDAAGDLTPKSLSQTGRRELSHMLKSHNLELIALGCPMRAGLDMPDGLEARIDYVKQVMSLSFDLGAKLAVAQPGKIPDGVEHPAYALLMESLTALGKHGDRTGTRIALETGLDSGESFKAFLDRFDTGGIAVAFDAANLIFSGFDPFEAARLLRDRIACCHAKDARRASASRPSQEVALGHGDIDWMAYLGLLEEIEFSGWLAVEREAGEDRVRDVAEGVKFLRRLMPVG